MNGPVDLLFEEAAVNDQYNGRTDSEQIRGMEGIVRQARLANPAMDIVLLHFVDPPKMELINRGQVPPVIANHEKIAARYNLPSIDLALEVTERIRAGEFTWEKDFIDLHPSPFGHQLYYRSISRLLDAAWKNPPTADAKIVAYRLPDPVDAKSYFHGRLVSLAEAKIETGWKLTPNWTPTDGAGTRPGFVDVPMLVATEPGADLCGCGFMARLSGYLSPPGRMPAWWNIVSTAHRFVAATCSPSGAAGCTCPGHRCLRPI